ncbi:MAG: gluconokinase [Ectothiorhodospiraceae bacterium]|nr:gluconokinase [Ectothiorhodospiraceae bacterium]
MSAPRSGRATGATPGGAGGLVLGIDIGTSGLRTALFDLEARVLAPTVAERRYRVRAVERGQAELDAPAMLRALRASLRDTLAGRAAVAGLARRPLLAVGGSCFWHSLLGVDAAGEPVTPVYTWADGRSAEDAARLRAQLDPHAVHRRTGCMIHSSFWPAKLAWVARTRPSTWRAVRHWMSPGEWLWWRLVGRPVCAHGMATGTGLYDPGRLTWDPGMVDAVGLDPGRLLPIDDHPVRPGTAIGRGLGALADAEWLPPIGDGAASNLGSGAAQPGVAAINLGTSAAVRVMRAGRQAVAPYGLFAYRVDTRRYLVGGAISNAGNLREWCARVLRLPSDPAALERALASRPMPAHGLDVLPFWGAERAPTWRDDVAGVIAGLTHASDAVDIVQALTEAGFQRLARVIELMPRGARPREVVVSGGGSRSGETVQRLADVLGRAVRPCREADASLRGAAVLALERLGATPPPPPLGRPVAPRAAPAAAHAARRRSQEALEARFVDR